ncbi:MAG: hypothetical protein RL538_760 [Candidatus Parcubacteria bacterium]|jgi:hypothetical protein
MKTCKTIGLLTALATAIAPSLALAQTAPAVQSISGANPTAAEYFGTIEIVRGVPLLPAEYAQVRDNGCFIGPANLVAPLMTKLDRRGEVPCSKAMFDKLDTVNKEGSTLFMVIRVGDGLEHCVSAKGISLTNNRIRCATYTFDPNSDGKGRYASDNYSQSGGAVVANTLSGLAQAFVGGPVTALTAGLMQRRNCCGNGGTPVNNVNYLFANSESNSEGNATVTSTGACLTGRCDD